MKNLTSNQKIHYTLRFAAAMCFIGHGAFGIITKPIWCNYFAVFGIGHDMAYHLMPVLGSIDILFGLIILFYPIRAVLSWLVIWGVVTASLRPLSHEPFAELIERAGNFGAPLALLMLSGGFKGLKEGLFKKIDPNQHISGEAITKVAVCLRIVVCLLLCGHGWLNVVEKAGLLKQYASLGFANPAHVAQVIGITEITAGFLVLFRPVSSLLIVSIVWKIISELFYPHYELFEWVERGGSYGSLIALWLILKESPTTVKSIFKYSV